MNWTGHGSNLVSRKRNKRSHCGNEISWVGAHKSSDPIGGVGICKNCLAMESLFYDDNFPW